MLTWEPNASYPPRRAGRRGQSGVATAVALDVVPPTAVLGMGAALS